MPMLPSPDAPFEMSTQNLVFTAVLGTSVRLKHVTAALAHCGAELNQKRFSAVILRTHQSARAGPLDEDRLLQQLRPVEVVRPKLSKIAILIFRNGNLVCTGAKTFAHARYMLARTAQQLREIGYTKAAIVRMNIRNMVGRAQLPCRIDRERMAREMPAFATYDPERFPGVSVKHPATRPITLLIFDSGRVVVTGTCSKPLADAALTRMKPLLMHFAVGTPEDEPMPMIVRTDTVADATLYDILEISPNASMKDLKKAFHTKARVYHPDKNPDLVPGTTPYRQNELIYKRLDAAYGLLSDREKRDLYDKTGEGVKVIDFDEEEEEEVMMEGVVSDSDDEVEAPPATMKDLLREDVVGLGW